MKIFISTEKIVTDGCYNTTKELYIEFSTWQSLRYNYEWTSTFRDYLKTQ